MIAASKICHHDPAWAVPEPPRRVVFTSPPSQLRNDQLRHRRAGLAPPRASPLPRLRGQSIQAGRRRQASLGGGISRSNSGLVSIRRARHRRRDLRHVQPQTVLWRVVDLQLPGDPTGTLRWERLVQRGQVASARFFKSQPERLVGNRVHDLRLAIVSASSYMVHTARPSGGEEQARAMKRASARPSSLICRAGRSRRMRPRAASRPSSTNRWRTRSTVAVLTSRASTSR